MSTLKTLTITIWVAFCWALYWYLGIRALRDPKRTALEKLIGRFGILIIVGGFSIPLVAVNDDFISFMVGALWCCIAISLAYEAVSQAFRTEYSKLDAYLSKGSGRQTMSEEQIPQQEHDTSQQGTLIILFSILALLVGIGICARPQQPNVPPIPPIFPTPTPAGPQAFDSISAADPNTFRIVAEHDVRNLEEAGLFEQFTKETGVRLTMTYRGPVDIQGMVARTSKENPKTVDAFWPASALWLSGSSSVSPETVMKTYVVLAVDPDTAAELGWSAGQRITAADLVGAAQAGKVKLAMTSATQSTPGAVFYLAMHTALSGKPVLTSSDLENPATLESLKTLLNGIDRSAAEVDHLKDVYVVDKVSGKHATNAIVIYESLAIQMNQELVAAGQKPMLIFYVEGATAIADAPLRYVDNGDDRKLEQYRQLVEFLQREDIVQRIQALGWRANQIGMAVDNPDPAVFNPAWGVDAVTEFQEMIFPKPPAARAALSWYQAYGRKPSFTVYCLDYSGSMSSNGGDKQMTDAMDLLLDQTRAAEVSLQATEQDVTMTFAFSSNTTPVSTRVTGNDPAVLKRLSRGIAVRDFGGGTAMFDCLKEALMYIKGNYDPETYAYSVIAMTDGASNQGASAADFIAFYQQGGYAVPVYGIAFGSPDFNQLNELAKTGGAVYDGRQDIALAFRAAKGNN